MRPFPALRAALATVLLGAACASAARAADAPKPPVAPAIAGKPAAAPGTTPAPAQPDPVQLRDRITQEIARGLARHEGQGAPAPAPATSHPTRIRTRARAHADTTLRAAPAPEPAPADTSADGTWAALLAGNLRFASGHPRARTALHAPAAGADARARAAVLACSDADASPEQVFDEESSALFVVRTSGNIVDPVALGSLEYAVSRQHARVLVVLGHSGCGAVRAAASGEEPGSAYQQAIVDRIRPVVQRLSACFEGEELVERSVIASARQSAQDVLANSALLRAAVSEGRLRVVCAVYAPATGAVTPVTVPAATAQAQAPAR